MSVFVGINGQARPVANMHVGVNGKARQVVAGYVGVNGKARQFYTSGQSDVFSFMADATDYYAGQWEFSVRVKGTGRVSLYQKNSSFNSPDEKVYIYTNRGRPSLHKVTIKGDVTDIELSGSPDIDQYNISYREIMTEILTPIPSSCNGQSFGEFAYNSKITSIPANLFVNCPQSTIFGWCFRKCLNLLEIPATLFDTCTNATDFSYCFDGCTALTGFAPELWDTNKFPHVTSHTACFRGCTSLSNYADIPDGWK